MRIVTTSYVIDALDQALVAPVSRPSPSAADEILSAVAADGWIDPADVETLIFSADPRLPRAALQGLCASLGIAHLSHVGRYDHLAAYMPAATGRVAVHDLARLLILLERAGLAVDPLPLCEALSAEPRTRHVPNAIRRRAQGSLPAEPLMLTIETQPDLTRTLSEEPAWERTTARRHRVEVWCTEYDDAKRVAIRIRPDRRKGQRRSRTSLAA